MVPPSSRKRPRPGPRPAAGGAARKPPADPPKSAAAPPPPSAEYDQFLYSNYPHAETHPDRLATLGTLFGLRPAPPAGCRVLELGCGLSGNLIAMAVAYPKSRFFGIDQSPRQVESGLSCVRTLGLDNVELRACDIRAFAEEYGPPFDYILCHGVFSWVPPEVQEAILTIMRRRLAPDGLAYVSYNTLPGWHMRGMVRDLLRRHVGDEGSVPERVARARAFLAFLEQAPRERATAHAYLRHELNIVGRLGDEYLYYEHLVGTNNPCYFKDFAADAARHELRYVTDAQFCYALPGRLALPLLPSASAEGDPIEVEQALDILDIRLFRRTLLCHAAQTPDYRVPWTRLRTLHVSCALAPGSPETPDLKVDVPVEFATINGATITTDLPLMKAALHILRDHHPRGLPFSELCDQAAHLCRPRSATASRSAQARIAESLLDMLAMGQLEVHHGSLSYPLTPGPRPMTTPLCRFQAENGEPACTNLRHEAIEVDDLDRALLRRMDGRLTQPQILRGVLADLAAGQFFLEEGGQIVRDPRRQRAHCCERLYRLARSALLLA